LSSANNTYGEFSGFHILPLAEDQDISLADIAAGKVPHTILKTGGRGRYAGCILSVVSADRSFWALESDESMFIDGKKTWQGTGLEDYFNAGWYYGNVFARPLHGLPIKAPFRTVQYRLHLTEPVLFDRNFELQFERGPDQASHAAYESVVFYYLEKPQMSGGRVENRAAPVDTLQPYTLMTDLWNFERFGDLQGCCHPGVTERLTEPDEEM